MYLYVEITVKSISIKIGISNSYLEKRQFVVNLSFFCCSMFSSQIEKTAESDSELSPSMPEIVFYTSLRDARESLRECHTVHP